MATIQSPTMKDVVYNGTHGNLSVAMGVIPQIAASVGDVIELIKLDAGVKLVDFKVAVVKVATSSPSAAVKVQLKPLQGSIVEVGTLDLTSAGDVDVQGWYPKELYDVPCVLQLKVTGAVKADDELYFKAFTASVGTI